MIKVKQVIKNNVLQTTPTQLFNSYEEVVTWLNTNLVNIFSYTGSAIATTSTTDKWIIDMHCLECDTTKDCLWLPKTAGTYELTVDANWNITRTPAVWAWTPFTCTDVTNCINTNTWTQTAISNLVRWLLNLPTAPWTYELVYNGTTYTWTTATWAGASFTCADVENCIRTNAGVQDAIRDLIFGNGNTTLCAAITAAWCAWSSSFPFSSAKSTSFSFSWSWTSNWNTSQVQNITSISPIAWLHIKWHIWANNNDWSSVWYAWGNVDLYYDAATNILYWTATSMYWWVWPYAAWNEYAVGWVSNAISFSWWSYIFNTYVESSISVTENTPSDFSVNFWAYHYWWADWYSFTWIIQVY